MKRRDALRSIGAGAIFVTSNGSVQGTSDNKSKQQLQILKQKYGKDEADIISKKIEDGENVETILKDPRLDNARTEYLRHKISMDSLDDVDDKVLNQVSAKSLGKLRKSGGSQRLSAQDTVTVRDNCMGSKNEEVVVGQDSNEIRRHDLDTLDPDVAGFVHVQQSTYGIGTTNWTMNCENFNNPGPGTKARATGGIYGGGEVTVRRLGELKPWMDLISGRDKVVGDFEAKGICPGGSASFSIVHLDSDTASWSTYELKSVSSSINGSFRGSGPILELSHGDFIGWELSIQADGTGGAATVDFMTKASSRKMEGEIEFYPR